jgi:hypothetical protein
MGKLRQNIPDEVKKAIVKVRGRKWPLCRMPREDKLIATYNFTNAQISSLAEQLNEIAKKYKADAVVYIYDVGDCKTVGDCVKVVIEAISES